MYVVDWQRLKTAHLYTFYLKSHSNGYVYFSTFVGVFTIKSHKGASVTRASGALIVKILNKHHSVYNLFYRQTAQYFIYTAICPYTSIVHVFVK